MKIEFKIYPSDIIVGKKKKRIYPAEISTNKFYSGLHWTIRSKYAKMYHELVNNILIENKFKMFNCPVIVNVYYNNNYDSDNQSIMTKMIIDGMKGLIIKDDSREFVSFSGNGFHNEDGIKVVVSGVL